jgi:hypothetical protein
VFWETDPVDGATGVELNRAISMEGAIWPGSPRLENERGEQVESTLHDGPQGFCSSRSARLVPKKPLSPNTRYVVKVIRANSSDETGSFEFTTGTETLPEVTLERPELRADVVRGTPNFGGCNVTPFGERGQLCLDVARTEEDLELTVLHGGDVVLRAAGKRVSYSLYDQGYWFGENPDCIELRRIAPNGQRSEPATLCGAELDGSAWPDRENSETWMQCHRGLEKRDNSADAGVGDDDDSDAGDAVSGGKASNSGCSALAAPASAYDATLAALSLALSLVCRRRVTRRHMRF